MCAKPLLKWPGGKRKLIRHLIPLIPASHRRLYEPFAGGAALFFTLEPDDAVLSDLNEDLINCYQQVKIAPEELIRLLRVMKNSVDDYYHVRKSAPMDPLERAARTIYLTKLSFNGIYRVNLAGEFNVPYGGKTHIQPLDEESIMSTSCLLGRCRLVHGDFESAVESAGAGDVVYLDPPYTVAHGENGFVKYNARIFSWEDQERLAHLAEELDQRGVIVIVSNADHHSVERLYSGFQKVVIHRASQIAASAQYRRPITECIFHNGRST